ncbi:cyclic AMP response element-binding protein B isoform X7 [Fopius arisanus]|uniref:Cyclic AMP response element-binding protein B isoform X7 n=1 Tax=Fopius arisanus TaxID=64838 RepID=A0A9R1U586_9HYME|nr:PREDICTED: cyclic AMP response element-binding protein B isoform X7 [Fopius arisanus]
MESMVEENGSAVDSMSPGSQSGDAAPAIATSVQSISRTHQQTHHLVASTSIVQLTLPASGTTQVQSVIQPNHQSVIQSATNIQPVALSKGNVILVKPNSVIQSTQANIQTLQVVDAGSDDSFSDEDSPKKRRDLLTRRASYRKILNDLSASEIAAGNLPPLESSLECDSNVDSDMSSHSLHYQTDYAGHGVVVEDAARKREMRLQKNREAARECRRKKKEYIKCLENRVAVLENRNQTLIDELKSLKELYQQKTD